MGTWFGGVVGVRGFQEEGRGHAGGLTLPSVGRLEDAKNRRQPCGGNSFKETRKAVVLKRWAWLPADRDEVGQALVYHFLPWDQW